jgi:hypothetical protein
MGQLVPLHLGEPGGVRRALPAGGAVGGVQGGAVQVDSLKATRFQPLHLKYDILVSNFAFKWVNLYRYNTARGVVMQAYGPLGSGDQFAADGPMKRKRSGKGGTFHNVLLQSKHQRMTATQSDTRECQPYAAARPRWSTPPWPPPPPPRD